MRYIKKKYVLLTNKNSNLETSKTRLHISLSRNSYQKEESLLWKMTYAGCQFIRGRKGGGGESPIPAWRHAEAEVVVGLARWHADVGGVADG